MYNAELGSNRDRKTVEIDNDWTVEDGGYMHRRIGGGEVMAGWLEVIGDDM